MSPQRLFILLLLFLPVVAQSLPSEVRDVRLWRAPDHTRVVLDLSTPVKHRYSRLNNPDRLVVDLLDANLNAPLTNIDVKNSPVLGVRSGIRNAKDLRLVFDLSESVRPRIFTLGANKQYGDRLVIDLYPENRKKAVVKRANALADKKRDIIVAIDAGHGGEDPGAIGPRHIREKNVVMSIARKLQANFNDKKGYRAELVRDGDYYVGLRKRRDIARGKQADLFISVHADAFKNKNVRGASVYALSPSGASSATAAFLAETENNADLVGGINLSDKEDFVAQVLTDLSMTGSLEASLYVGKGVLSEMGRFAKLHSREVEQAAFAVLKSPDIPSILVETGFISNPTEAKRLAQPGYQKKMARAIFMGVDKYFNQKPPPGTYLAWLKERGGLQQTRYVVRKGDTLSGIAVRHGVSVSAIVSQNKLKKKTVLVGQKLRIPVLQMAKANVPKKPAARPRSEYVIVRGDTLSEIAQRFHISSAAIRRENGLANNSIRVGQKITIPAS